MKLVFSSFAGERRPRAAPAGAVARTSRRGRWGWWQPAFTLTEILIAIVLIVLLTGITVVNFDSMGQSVKDKPVGQILHDAVAEARFQALYTHRATILAYDPGQNAFMVEDKLLNTTLAVFPTNLDISPSDKPTLKFYPELPVPDATSAVYSADKKFSEFYLTQLSFHPSGVSTPVKVEFEAGQGTPALTFELDAFNSAPPPPFAKPGASSL